MQVKVTRYSCKRDGDLPVYVEQARLRMSGIQDLAVGDSIEYDGQSYTIDNVQLFPSACRTVVDITRAGLDQSLATTFEVYKYRSIHGMNAGEVPELVGQINASLIHEVNQGRLSHDSRQWVGRYRAYFEPKEALQLDHLSILVSPSETLKVVSIYDLNRAGKLPFAVVEQSNLKLPG